MTKPQFDKIYDSEQMRIESSCGRSRLWIEYEVGDNNFVHLYTDGGARVTFTGEQAGKLAAFLVNRFPLDALGSV